MKVFQIYFNFNMIIHVIHNFRGMVIGLKKFLIKTDSAKETMILSESNFYINLTILRD
jgi:hypothetical protein